MDYVVYTDLDGTLLDHRTYQYDAAMPAIRLLKHQKFPIIPVTSKTRAEVLPLRKELELDSPLIIENGAAVFLPESMSARPDELTAKLDGFFVKAFAPDMAYWAGIITRLHRFLPEAFIAFSELSITEISELTGLPPEKAVLAGQREFSDPLHWYGNEQQFSELVDVCHVEGISVVRGGRFVHLLKGSSKGVAVHWLHRFMQEQSEEPLISIGLGDGENDLAFLEEVNLPVQIRSETHDFPNFQHEKLYRTNEVGPAGWAEAVFTLLKKH